MILLIEENPYHQDILECYLANIANDSVLTFTGSVNGSSGMNAFSFFYLIYLLLFKKINFVCFNTLEKPKSAFLAMCCILKGIKFEFISHNFDCFFTFKFPVTTKKKVFRAFVGQLILKRASKVYVLTDDVFSYVIRILPNSVITKLNLLELSHMSSNGSLNFHNDSSEFVCVLGPVDYSRRNYQKLIAYSKTSEYVIYILGNINLLGGRDFMKVVNESNLSNRFKFFESFIPQNEFIELLIKAKSVLDISMGDEYGKIKSSSTAILTRAMSKECHQL